MEYTKGRVNRIFVLKFNDDDILLKELERFATSEKLRSALIVFLGALKKGDLVTGPRKPVIPPKPNWTSFKDAWEVFGIGTIFMNKNKPQIHIHTAMGKRTKTLAGCVRKESKVFLVLEAVVFELKGVGASKSPDPKTGLNLLRIVA